MSLTYEPSSEPLCTPVQSGDSDLGLGRDWYRIAEQPAPAPHLAHPEGCAALRIVLVTVPRVSRACEHFPDGFDLHLLQRVDTLLPHPAAAAKERFRFS